LAICVITNVTHFRFRNQPFWCAWLFLPLARHCKSTAQGFAQIFSDG